MSEEKGKKKAPFKSSVALIVLTFLLGFGIMVYPIISRLYYRSTASNEVEAFDTGVSALPDEEVERRIELARGYNAALKPIDLVDPYRELKEEGIAEYARMLEVQEKIGHVQIPRLNEDLPVYAGTSESVLQKGVGHLEGTSLPVGGLNNHAVLTAHRGLPSAKLFSDLDKMEIGDKFYIHNIKETLAYEVDDILVVEPNDFEPVLIKEGQDYVTLLTCTPYMINSHRLLVRGHRVEYVAAVLEKELADNQTTNRYKYLFYVALALVVIVLAGMITSAIKKRKGSRQ